MRNIEFHTDPRSGESMYGKIGDTILRQVFQNSREIIEPLLYESENFYPEQWAALCEIYKSSSQNRPFYDFLRARRIINCCFGSNDRQPDIDEYGNYHFEHVKCPLIAECKYHKIVCAPKFQSKLSNREWEVMNLLFQRIPVDKVAERLYISIHTVTNHKKNALRRLRLHSFEEFVDYAHRKKMFKNL